MATDPASTEIEDQQQRNILFPRGSSFLAIGGVGFIYGSVAAFGVACYQLVTESRRMRGALLVEYVPELILVAIGVFGAILGVILLRSVGLASVQEPNRVINRAEWETIRSKVEGGDEKAVDQYIRLTSLTGFTGAFTKLGLTGLPLATIGLTIFFSLLSVSYQEIFLDLAKLTLGAFIGSFVQKQVGTSQGSVTLPTGERVRVDAPVV